MGAKERRLSMREGQKVIDAMNKKTIDGVEITDIDLEQFATDLVQFATEIVEDFEEQRENLSSSENLLARWEDSTGHQSEEWDSVVSDLDDYSVDITVDENGDDVLDVDSEIDRIVEIWNQGPQ